MRAVGHAEGLDRLITAKEGADSEGEEGKLQDKLGEEERAEPVRGERGGGKEEVIGEGGGIVVEEPSEDGGVEIRAKKGLCVDRQRGNQVHREEDNVNCAKAWRERHHFV